jgi:subtilisin-like proprotein convertase family protein
VIGGVSVVSGSGDRTFNISFAKQTTPGTYTLYIGRNARDLIGNSITAYSNAFKLVPAPVPTHVISSTRSGPAAGTLSTIQVTFNSGVSASSFRPFDVGLIGPAGHIAITGVTVVPGSNNCTFNISFATQTRAGTYTLYVGSNVKDLAGKAIAAYSAAFKLVAAPTPTHVVSSSARGPSADTLSTIQVTFSQAVSPSTFVPDNLGLIGPAGHVAITGATVVPGSDNRTFKITFATQTRGGTYTLYVGSNVKDLAGKAIAPYEAAFKITATTRPPSTASFTSSNAVTIRAGGAGISLLKITQNLTIAHITVKVNIRYPQVGDLYIHLEAPDGTEIVLSQWMGGNAANFPGTTFDDNAGQSIAFAAGPYTGSYQPLTALSYLDGKSTQGTWRLWVENRGTLTGTVTSWSLNVKAS